jgi:hypothetical protein
VSASLNLIPDLSQVRHAGESLAAAWFQFCGYGVGTVSGQRPYDLLAVSPGGETKKVQVKTSTSVGGPYRRPRFHIRTRNYLSPDERTVVPYDEQDVDLFFLISTMQVMWLVPHERLLGQTHCNPGPEFDIYRVRWPE